MKEWVLPTVGTFICWGLWSFIPKITTKYIDPRSAIIFEVIGGIVLSLVVLSVTNFRLETHPKGIALFQWVTMNKNRNSDFLRVHQDWMVKYETIPRITTTC